MTRESKIALLVGLGFIICFGVILSEARTDKIAQAPGAVVLPVDPGAAEQVVRLEAMTVVLPRWRSSDPSEVADQRAASPAPVAVIAPAPARRTPAPQPIMGMYTVVEGDRLSKIAVKVYGPGCAGEYQRIFEANRDVLSNANQVRPGQKLRIPALESIAADSRVGQVRVMDGPQLRRYLSELERSQQAARRPRATYTVQPNDTLTAIARKTIGSGSHRAVTALYQLNRDTIANPDQLRVGAVLVLPE